MKKIFTILLFMFILFYSPVIVNANVTFEAGIGMECSISAVLSDDRIINLIVNDDDKYKKNDKWFHAIIYDADKQSYEDIALDNQVDDIFHSMNDIWIYHIDILPTNNGGFMICIPFNQGYYFDLYDNNFKHLDSKTIIGGNTYLEMDGINTDVHHTIKYGLGKALICIKNDMKYGYTGDTCYRIAFDNIIEISQVEVPQNIVFGSYIPMPNGSVLAVEWNGDRIYHSFPDGSYEKADLHSGIYDILKMGRNNLPSQWTFHKDNLAEIVTLDYSNMKLVEVIIDNDLNVLSYKNLADNLNDEWDFAFSELIVHNLDKVNDNYYMTCWSGKDDPNYGTTWEYTIERVLDRNGCTTHLFKYRNGDRVYLFHENICRLKDNQYVMVKKDGFESVVPDKIHDWDDGQLISSEVGGAMVAHWVYNCAMTGDKRSVLLDACGIMYNNTDFKKDIEYCKLTLNAENYTYTGYEITPEETVYYGSQKLINGQDYEVKYENNIDAGIATIVINGKGNYYGVRTLNYEILMLDKPDIVPEDYYEVNYSMDSVDNIILPEQWEFDNPDEILKPGLNTNIKVLYKGKDRNNYSITDKFINIYRNDCVHEWDEGTVVKEATIDETGIRIYKCKICRITKNETIDMLPKPEKENESEEVNKPEEPAGEENGKSEEPAGEENGKSEEPAGGESGKSEEPAGEESGKSEEPAGEENGKSEEPAGEESGKSEEPTREENEKTEPKLTENEPVLKIEKNNYIIYKKNIYIINNNKTLSFLRPQNSKVKKITIPNSVKYKKNNYKVVAISDCACQGLKRLKIVIIGDNVKLIGRQAFANCKALKDISFGRGVKKLGDKVLDGNKSLKRVMFKSTKISTFGKKTFRKVPKKVDIIIPRKKINKYIVLIKKAK